MALNASQEIPRVFVRHDRMMANAVETVSRLFSDLEALGTGMRGLSRPSEREINAFFDPSLNRAKAHGSAADPLLTPEQQAVAAMLRGELTQGETLDVSAPSLEAMAEVKERQAMAVQAMAASTMVTRM